RPSPSSPSSSSSYSSSSASSSASSAVSIASASARTILPVADATLAVPTIGAPAGRTPRTSAGAMASPWARPRLAMYENGGASTATSAAMRTSISVWGSRLLASTDAAFITASRSRTGVSLPISSDISLLLTRPCGQIVPSPRTGRGPLASGVRVTRSFDGGHLPAVDRQGVDHEDVDRDDQRRPHRLRVEHREVRPRVEAGHEHADDPAPQLAVEHRQGREDLDQPGDQQDPAPPRDVEHQQALPGGDEALVVEDPDQPV